MRRKEQIRVFIYLMIVFFMVTACKGGELEVTSVKPVPNFITIGSSTLSWGMPTAYTDGSPLIVTGYKVYYGTTAGTYDGVIDISSNVSLTDASSLFSGASATFYFAVTAYDASGQESDHSNEASKYISIP